MSNSLQSLIDFNPLLVKYISPKSTSYAKTWNVISTHKSPRQGVSMLFQTPVMGCFGIEDGERNGIHDNKFKIKFLFMSDSNSRVDMLREKIIAFQEKMIDDAFELKWFENISRQEIKNRFKPIYNINNSDADPKKNAFIKISVSNYNGNWDTLQIYDKDSNIIFPNDKEQLPADLVTANSNVSCSINITQIWIKHNKLEWGCSLKLIQCIVIPPILKVEVEPATIFQLSDEDMADFVN
jgi:hypothetical protein